METLEDFSRWVPAPTSSASRTRTPTRGTPCRRPGSRSWSNAVGGLAATQREGVIDVHAAAAQKRTIRRAMIAGPITHLAEVGRFAAREDHELAKSFIFKPSADSYHAFRTAAGTMAAAAQTHKELLMKHGLSESVLNLFVQLLDQFDSAVRLGTTGRASHRPPPGSWRVAVEIGRTVRVMDAHNQQRFKNDGQLLGTWNSVRTVLGKPRSVSTPKDEETAPHRQPAVTSGRPHDPGPITPAYRRMNRRR